MATLAIFAWLFAIVMMLVSWGILHEADLAGDDPRVWILGILCLTFFVGFAISWDIYGNIVPSNEVACILLNGLVALGLSSVVPLVVLVARGSSYGFSFSDLRCSGLVAIAIQLIALISSVLGIISFYLEYIR